MRIAVIDLGTNTCNLLIAEISNGGYKILHQSKQLVKLGDGKIRENEISKEATQRTINAFLEHKKVIEQLNTDKYRAIATSAVRTAKNKIQFLNSIGDKTGFVVKVVSGEKEAGLIFNGVLLAFNELKQPAVILDIGGGSNEMILAHKKEVIFKQSRPTGMLRVINNFNLSEPITKEEISKLHAYFSEQHHLTFENCKKAGVEKLIGCSGAFDTIADMADMINPGEKRRTAQKVSLQEFENIYERIIASTHNERLKIKGVDHARVDLIVPAVVLIRCLIKEIGIKKIVQTDFALREGVIYEMLH